MIFGDFDTAKATVSTSYFDNKITGNDTFQGKVFI